MKLRHDERQWLIYQPDRVVPAIRAVETLCMMIAGEWFASHPDIQLRALGNVAQSLAESRFRYAAGTLTEQPTDNEQAAHLHAAAILAYLRGQAQRPEVAEDELHAAVFWLHSHLSGAGIDGPGWERAIAKGNG